jgi:hypothetical protein
MTDLLICDFIEDSPDDRPSRQATREATGWETVIFELEDEPLPPP